MKRLFLSLSILLNFILVAIVSYSWYANRNKVQYFNFVTSKFQEQVLKIDSTERICLVGNSITANWIKLNKSFFEENRILNRGIGGNSSSQILLRFQQDVISTNPTFIVLNTGINDIGKADGFYNEDFTIQNIQSIIDICRARDITLILTSVLPATEVKINRVTKIEDVQSKILKINKEIVKLSAINKLEYVDYYGKLKDEDETFNNNYTFDGVHPNAKGYEIMEKLLLQTINKIKLQNN